MLFSSSIFLFLLLPLTIAVYYGLLRKSRPLQNVFLLAVSLFFYGWGEPKFVFVMMLSILMNWLFSLLVDRYRQSAPKARAILAAATVFNLGIMFVFKYLMFTLENINSLFSLSLPVPEITLPIGISFFTFQAFSYVIDVYRGHGELQKNPLYVGLYISFFPQLIAGPIVRYQTVADEIKHRKENLEDFTSGSVRFMVGFVKKVLVANTAALVADAAFDSTKGIGTAFAWLGAIAYTLQIYYDFSGYSDMAIGLGRMFGFHFLENFDYPYASKSVSEFWRRWHISLGTWFRDYVYFPLGGSRVKSKGRLIFNLFAVWFLTGLWHGANWTFILWGLFYFVLLVIEKLTGLEKKAPNKLPVNILRHIYTLFFVVMGWVLFRAENLTAALQYIKTMFGFGESFIDGGFIFNLENNAVVLAAGAVLALPVAKKLREKLGNKYQWTDIPYAVFLAALFICAVSYVVKGSYNPFIYFNF